MNPVMILLGAIVMVAGGILWLLMGDIEGGMIYVNMTLCFGGILVAWGVVFDTHEARGGEE